MKSVHRIAALRETLLGLEVDLTELDPEERLRVDQGWLAAFAGRVKTEHGVAVYRRYRWHGYSYRLQPCLEGPEALAEYLRQRPAPFYVFDEALTFCALCHSRAYPDLSDLRHDVYVSHHHMRWTMAFTHEQPHIGPFFAVRE